MPIRVFSLTCLCVFAINVGARKNRLRLILKRSLLDLRSAYQPTGPETEQPAVFCHSAGPAEPDKKTDAKDRIGFLLMKSSACFLHHDSTCQRKQRKDGKRGNAGVARRRRRGSGGRNGRRCGRLSRGIDRRFGGSRRFTGRIVGRIVRVAVAEYDLCLIRSVVLRDLIGRQRTVIEAEFDILSGMRFRRVFVAEKEIRHIQHAGRSFGRRCGQFAVDIDLGRLADLEHDGDRRIWSVFCWGHS